MRVYVIQLEHSDIETKSERIRRAVSLIKGLDSPELILLPELWGTGFFSYEKYAENAEELYGETAAALSDAARDKGSYIFTGSFIERRRDKLYNTALLLDKSGNIAAEYRKIPVSYTHLDVYKRQLEDNYKDYMEILNGKEF